MSEGTPEIKIQVMQNDGTPEKGELSAEKKLDEHLGEINLSNEEKTLLQNALNEKYTDRKETVIKITQAQLDTLKKTLQDEKSDDNIELGESDLNTGNGNPGLSKEEIEHALSHLDETKKVDTPKAPETTPPSVPTAAIASGVVAGGIIEKAGNHIATMRGALRDFFSKGLPEMLKKWFQSITNGISDWMLEMTNKNGVAAVNTLISALGEDDADIKEELLENGKSPVVDALTRMFGVQNGDKYRIPKLEPEKLKLLISAAKADTGEGTFLEKLERNRATYDTPAPTPETQPNSPESATLSHIETAKKRPGVYTPENGETRYIAFGETVYARDKDGKYSVQKVVDEKLTADTPKDLKDMPKEIILAHLGEKIFAKQSDKEMLSNNKFFLDWTYDGNQSQSYKNLRLSNNWSSINTWENHAPVRKFLADTIGSVWKTLTDSTKEELKEKNLGHVYNEYKNNAEKGPTT